MTTGSSTLSPETQAAPQPAGSDLAQALLDRMRDAAYALDGNWRFVAFNTACERHFGVGRAEVLGRDIRDALPGVLGEELEREYRRVLQEHSEVEVEVDSRVDPSIRVNVRIFPLAGGIGAVFHDLTRDRALEAALRHSEAGLRRLVESNIVGIMVSDARGAILEANEAFLSLIGRDRRDLEAGRLNWRELTPPHLLGRDDAAIADALLQGACRPFEKEYLHADGSSVPVQIAFTPLPGWGERFVCVVLDLTERRRSEAALRKSEARYRAVFEQAAVGVEWLSLDGRIIDANGRLCAMLGYERDELVGRASRDLTHPDDRGELDRLLARLLTGEIDSYAIDKRYLRKDGTPVWIRVTSSLAGNDAGLHRISIVEDVTERKRAERSLGEREAQLSAIFEQATVGLAQTDLDGRFVLVNDRYCELVGRPRAELLGLGIQDVTHPDDLPRNMEMLAASLEAGTPFAIEKRYVRPDGRIVWVHNNVTIVRGGDGEPRGIVAVSLDVSERRAADERQRLLMREVDHRAKNALAVVQALVRLTRAETQEGFVSAVEGRVAALARTHTLLAKAQWTGVELTALLENELAPYGSGDRESVGLDGPAAWLVPDAVQPLGMIFHELATNAAKYGALAAATGRVRISWKRDPATSGLELVWDESGGPGCAAPVRHGFGSTLVERNARHLGGRIETEWRPEGLRLVLHLPARLLTFPRDVAPAEPRPAVPAARQLDRRRVLVVEDETTLGLMAERILADLGCVPVGLATTLTDAIRLASFEDIDMAILDVNLRGRSVQPVAEILRERGIPFLFATGYGEVDWEVGPTPILRKPFQHDDLARALFLLDRRE